MEDTTGAFPDGVGQNVVPVLVRIDRRSDCNIDAAGFVPAAMNAPNE
jgi:hypothetical protein